MGVKIKKKNSGEIFVRMFQACNNPQKEKTPKNGPKKATPNSWQRIPNLEDKKTDIKNSEGF